MSAEVIAQIKSRAINVATDLPQIYINHADILLATNDKAAALATLDETIEKYRNEPIEMIDLLAAKLNLLQRLDSTQEAIAIADGVFAIIESQRMEFDTVRLGPYWSGRTERSYTRPTSTTCCRSSTTGRRTRRAPSRYAEGREQLASACGAWRRCWPRTKPTAQRVRNGSISFPESRNPRYDGKPSSTTSSSKGALVRLRNILRRARSRAEHRQLGNAHDRGNTTPACRRLGSHAVRSGAGEVFGDSTSPRTAGRSRKSMTRQSFRQRSTPRNPNCPIPISSGSTTRSRFPACC